VSSNSNLPDLETNNNVNHGNDPKPNKTHPVNNGMSFQQSRQQQEKQQQKQPPETHIPINKQLCNEVIVKKKEYGPWLSCCPCSASLLKCISQSKVND